MTDRDDAADGFLSRWARRKALVRDGVVAPEAPAAKAAAVPAPPPDPAPSAGVPEVPVAEPGANDERPLPPTLADGAQLEPGADYRRFVASDVTPEVKNAALKKLFAEPQFNVMDGLDTYIDDYGKPDPIPPAMLRQMVQSQFLGLFDAEDDDTKSQVAGAIPDGAAPAPQAKSDSEPMPQIADDQDAAVRLQPLDAAGPPRDPGGAGEDAGRER